jgi:glycosyltransferase involved in cell wall biosynthesis
LAALEAMAAKAVVISTNAGGLAEINIQNETGFLADVGDTKAMSDFAISLLRDEKKLAAMKEAAYEQACRFDIKNIIPIYEKLYSQYCRRTPCK